jgi:hypothetical protein
LLDPGVPPQTGDGQFGEVLTTPEPPLGFRQRTGPITGPTGTGLMPTGPLTPIDTGTKGDGPTAGKREPVLR